MKNYDSKKPNFSEILLYVFIAGVKCKLTFGYHKETDRDGMFTNFSKQQAQSVVNDLKNVG